MKKYLIAGNWKMNTNADEAVKLCVGIRDGLVPGGLNPAVTVLVCPPFTSLSAASGITRGTAVQLGAQNCYPADSGAFTGEISAPMLNNLGCAYCIVGHSERRTYFHETDSFINSKIKALLIHGIKPILCVGETLDERKSGSTFEVLERQLRDCLEGISRDAMKEIVVAYEPVWAIGTGLAATTEQAQEAHARIRQFIGSALNGPADDMLILYGGSMNDKNAGELLSQKDVNGGLIGGASLKAEAFLSIIKTANSLS